MPFAEVTSYNIQPKKRENDDQTKEPMNNSNRLLHNHLDDNRRLDENDPSDARSEMVRSYPQSLYDFLHEDDDEDDEDDYSPAARRRRQQQRMALSSSSSLVLNLKEGGKEEEEDVENQKKPAAVIHKQPKPSNDCDHNNDEVGSKIVPVDEKALYRQQLDTAQRVLSCSTLSSSSSSKVARNHSSLSSHLVGDSFFSSEQREASLSLRRVISKSDRNLFVADLGLGNYSERSFKSSQTTTERSHHSFSSRPGAEHVQRPVQGLTNDSIIVQQQLRMMEQSLTTTSSSNSSTNHNRIISVEASVVPESPMVPSPSTTAVAVADAAATRGRSIGKTTVRLWKELLAALVLVTAVAILLGVLLYHYVDHNTTDTPISSLNNTTANTSTTTTPASAFDPFTLDCSVIRDQPQPHVITQCHCQGNVSKIPEDVAVVYDELMQSLVPAMNITFLPQSMSSCSPYNQALLWLASGDGMATTNFSSTNFNHSSDTSTTMNLLLQRYQVAVLFIEWNGPSWNSNNGWLSASDECGWYGLSCNDQDQVTDIVLSQNNLVGELAPLIMNHTTFFPHLVTLVLDQNNFANSSIPSHIGWLTNLQSLVLSSTMITGSIPSELFDLHDTLQDVMLDSNLLTGTIPTRIGELSMLQQWNVRANSIQGTIPTEIGTCKDLTVFDVGENHLNGTIPNQVDRLTKLQSWDVSFNDLSGTVPSGIWTANLTSLRLDNNGLSGTIPTVVGLLMALQYFDLQQNDFTGTIPTQVGLCMNLIEFRVGRNKLNGTLPNELGNLVNISDQFSGGTPAGICHLFSVNNFFTSCFGCNCF